MDHKQILKQIKEFMIDVIQSSRWNNPNNPSLNYITSIGERVNSIILMQEFRKNEDYLLLLEIANEFEESLNDDWMPYKIIGLELISARQFLIELVDRYNEIAQVQWTASVREIYNKIKVEQDSKL